MQKAEGRRQNHGEVFNAILASALALLLPFQLAYADGGTLRLSQRCEDCRVSVFTSPGAPCVGPMDISVLVQDAATGQIRDDMPAVVRLRSIELPGLTLQQKATAGAATNKLFHAAVIDVPEAGKWRAEILVGNESYSTSDGDRNFPTLAFDFDVASLPAEWLSLAAWLIWPIAVVGIFLAHQVLAARSAPKHLLRAQSRNRQIYVDTI
jgi:hypothetical protein